MAKESVLAAFLLVVPAAVPADEVPVPPALGEVRVRAESYEQRSQGHVEARGLVDLRLADVRVQADKVDVFEDEQPDGSTRQRIVAEGNVVFIRGEERLSGDRLELDDTGKGKLSNAAGYLEPGVFVKARQIERLDADSYRVLGGTFTSCSQPNPRWNFSASRAKVEVDRRITGTNAVFKVKGVPAFYTPYVYYPLGENQRSTGFLLPSVGYSVTRGYNLQAGFFWAMGRSADQTFWLDSYTRAGYGLGHELRWVGRASSRFTLRSRLFDAKGSGGTDYTLAGDGLHQFPGALRASATVHLSSSTAFAQQSVGDSVRSVRSSLWDVSLERDFGFATLSAYGKSTDGGRDKRVDGSVPGLRLRRFPRPFWGGLVFGLEGSANRVRYGTQTKVDNWTHYEFAPTLSRPLRVSFLEIDPSVGYRYVRYGTRAVLDETGGPVKDENGEIETSGSPIDRSFFETAVALRGPTFARVFDTPGFGYSDRFKHTIGPEISWTHTIPVADFAGIPPSGKPDPLAGRSRIDYALAQRFYAKRRGSSGRTMPYELLSWRLAQTYYVQGPKVLGTDEGPERLGPITSRVTLRPTPQHSFDYVLEYDRSAGKVRSTTASVSTRWPGLFLEAHWSRTLKSTADLAKLATADATQRDRTETLAGNTLLDLVPGRLTLEGSVDYDVAARKLWQVRGLVRYSTQCCGFTVEHNWRRLATGPPDAQWRFSVELANLGSIGGSPPARWGAVAPARATPELRGP